MSDDDLFYLTLLSDKQILFRNYLIKKLGFVEDEFLQEYLYQLENSAPRYKYLGALPAEYEVVTDTLGHTSQKLKGADRFKTYEQKHKLFVPKNYNILDFLNQEYKIKKGVIVKPKNGFNSFISATDISNFTYCPVSFAISKTFDIVKIEAAYLGTDLHEEKRLINLLPKHKIDGFAETAESKKPKQQFINSKNEYFFEEIYRSNIIYNGHASENEKKYFKSFKGDFVGQPDYIFQNKNKEFFVVEEKFQFQVANSAVDEEKRMFYPNHINQLLSYLHGISDYDIRYGYVVYWKFDFDWGNPFVHSCYVLKITKSETTRNQIISIYNKLKDFLSNKTVDFNVKKRHPKKCANCVSNLICGHKTGQFNTLTFPYSYDFLKTKFVEFPKELKKDIVAED